MRDLQPEIAAAADEIERTRRLPPRLVEALIEAGLFRLAVPRSLGGGEATLGTLSRLMEELAQADASTAWCISQNAGVCQLAPFLPEATARQIFGDPRLTTAGGYGPATATPVAGGYRLTGRWAFGSGLHHATWLRASCDLAGESESRGAATAQQTTLFIPIGDAIVEDVWNVSGLRGTGSDTYFVADLFVPAERAILKTSREPGTLYVFGTNQVFSVGFASVALGLARASLDSLLELAVEKTPRGLSGRLRDQPAVQARIALAEAALRSSRAFLHEAIEGAWACAEATHALPLEHRAMLRLATTYAIQQAASVVDVAYTSAGGTAIFADAPFERRFRDMHAVTQQVQARSDHFEYVGQYLFGMQPENQWL